MIIPSETAGMIVAVVAILALSFAFMWAAAWATDNLTSDEITPREAYAFWMFFAALPFGLGFGLKLVGIL